jgi:hypothetical protein
MQSSTATHTPGPWHFGPSNAVNMRAALFGRSREPGDETLIGAFDVSAVLDKAEQEANRRLIKTAPDLLEAVRMAEATLTELWFDGVWGEEGKEPPILTQLRTALFAAQRWES